jgi:DNA-binding transcriptional LysR family regulator
MPDPIELRHLKNLTVVVEEGNISRAAIRLYISQSSLSQQMKQLEVAAQACLLVRHHGGVHATPAAEILIAGNKQIVKLCEDLLAAARAINTAPLLPLRLGFSSFVDHDLYEMVCSIHKSLFPSCEIRPQSGDPVDLLRMLEEREIDAALVTLPASGAGLTAYPFTQSRLVVCMKSDDPLSKLKQLTPADLGSKLTIFREPKQHPEAHERLMEMLGDAGISSDIVSTNKTPHDLQWMVESGRGYALIPEGSPLQEGLVTRPIANVTWTVDSALIIGGSTSQKTLPRLVKELRRRFRMLAKLPPTKPVRSVRPSIGDKILPLFG